MNAPSPSAGAPQPPSVPNALSGTVIGVGAILLFFAGQLLLAPLGVAGLGLSQWLFLAAPVLIALRAGRFDLSEALALRPIEPRTLTGAGLVMFGGLGFNSVVAWLQSYWMEIPVELLEALEEALRPSGPVELVGILVAAALTPAVCEEVVFRGMILQSWRRWPAVLAVGANALLFGAIHWVPGSAFRVLPAAVSGAFIGWAVWRTRSLWVGVWMHALNNGFLLLAAMTLPGLEEPGPEGGVGAGLPEAPHPLAVGLFALLIVAGSRLMRPHPSIPRTSR